MGGDRFSTGGLAKNGVVFKMSIIDELESPCLADKNAREPGDKLSSFFRYGDYGRTGGAIGIKLFMARTQ